MFCPFHSKQYLSAILSVSLRRYGDGHKEQHDYSLCENWRSVSLPRISSHLYRSDPEQPEIWDAGIHLPIRACGP